MTERHCREILGKVCARLGRALALGSVLVLTTAALIGCSDDAEPPASTSPAPVGASIAGSGDGDGGAGNGGPGTAPTTASGTATPGGSPTGRTGDDPRRATPTVATTEGRVSNTAPSESVTTVSGRTGATTPASALYATCDAARAAGAAPLRRETRDTRASPT